MLKNNSQGPPEGQDGQDVVGTGSHIGPEGPELL